MHRHKRVLVLVRLVFFVLIAAMAIDPFSKGRLSPVLPILLLAYLFTNLAMVFEKSASFFTQRVQACLLLFDICVLVVSLVYLDQYRQGLFLAMFLVVLLASAGQKLSVSIGGFTAVAALYTWVALNSPEEKDRFATIVTGLPVLFVVAIYVGYVTEAVARERRQRLEAEDRLQKELHGMSRVQALTSSLMMEPDPSRVHVSIAETARTMLGTPYAALFSRTRPDSPFEAAAAPGFPEALARRWAQASPAGSLLARAFAKGAAIRFTPETADPSLAEALADGQGGTFDEILLVPFADRVSGTEACLVVAFARPHVHLKVEEEAAQVLVQHAALCVENATLHAFLTQTRDVWQASFLSVPAPVIIVDAQGKVLQANTAFLTLGEFDLSTLVGSPFSDVLDGAPSSDGETLGGRAVVDWSSGSTRMRIPRLGGEFDVIRGPYLGAGATGTVWVLRKLSAEVRCS